MPSPVRIPSLPSTVDPRIRAAFDEIRRYFTAAEVEGGLLTQRTASQVYAPAATDPVAGYLLPKPSGLVATSMIGGVFLEWDIITIGGVAFVEILRSETNDVGTSVTVGQSDVKFFVDYIDGDEVDKTYFYWIRYIGTDGTPGPVNAMSGTVAEAKADPAVVIATIAGKIGQSELEQNLINRINLIDAPETGLVSTVSSILATQDQFSVDLLALDQSIASESTRLDGRVDEIVNQDIPALGILIENEEQQRILSDQASIETSNAITATMEGDVAESILEGVLGSQNEYSRQRQLGRRVAGVESEQSALATALEAEAGRIDALVAQVDDNRASIVQEQLVRASEIATEARIRSEIAVRVSTAEAAIIEERSARITADLSEAEARESLQASFTQQLQQTASDILSGLTPAYTWDFNDTVEGWTGSSANVSQSGSDLVVDQTGAGAYIEKTGLEFDGGINTIVLLFVKRTAGVFGDWIGKLRWATNGHAAYSDASTYAVGAVVRHDAGVGEKVWICNTEIVTPESFTAGKWTERGVAHGFSDSYRQSISEPADDGNYHSISISMRSPVSGGSDWTDNIISGIQLFLGTDADDSFAVHSISINKSSIEQTLFNDLGERLTTAEAGIDEINNVTAGSSSAAARKIAEIDATVTDASTGLPAAHAAIGEINDVSAGSGSAAARAIAGLRSDFDDPVDGVDAAHSAIQEINEVSAQSGSAAARAIAGLVAQVDDASTGLPAAHAAIGEINDVSAGSGSAAARAIAGLVAQVNDPDTGLAASIAELQDSQSATAGDLTAEANRLELTRAELSSAETDNAEATLETILAAAQERERLPAVIGRSLATVLSEISAIATANSALASRIDGLLAQLNEAQSAIVQEQLVRASETGAEARLRSLLSAIVNDPATGLPGAYAAIQEEASARASGDSANATSIQQVTARLDQAGGQGVTLEQKFSAEASRTSGLEAQYSIKIDADGFISGFGLSSEVRNGIPFSEFILNVNRFALVDPGTTRFSVVSITRAAGIVTVETDTDHPFKVGSIVAIAGAAQKDYNSLSTVSEVVDARSFKFLIDSEPDSPATIASGYSSIKCGLATVPFVVQNGKVFINAAIIGEASIGSAQIQDAAIVSAHIAELSADLIKSGIIDGIVVKSTDPVTGMYSLLSGGALEFYKDGRKLYYLRAVKTGQATSGTPVVVNDLPRIPEVLVSLRDLTSYKKDYANQDQRWEVRLDDTGITDLGDGSYQFTPLAQLKLGSTSSSMTIGSSGSGITTSTFTSPIYVTPNNATSIAMTGRLNSIRGNGSSGTYFKRKCTIILYYRITGSGSAYSSVSTVVNHGSDLTEDTFSISKTGLTPAAYDFYLVFTWADLDGTTFTSGTVEYDESTVSSQNLTTFGTANAYYSTTNGVPSDSDSMSITAPTIPSGWSAFAKNGVMASYSAGVDYNVTTPWSSSGASASARATGPAVDAYLPLGNESRSLSESPSWKTVTWNEASIKTSFSYTCTAYSTGASMASAQMTYRNLAMTVNIRKPKASSTTQNNSYLIDGATFNLSSATVIDNTGVVNWIAVA